MTTHKGAIKGEIMARKYVEEELEDNFDEEDDIDDGSDDAGYDDDEDPEEDEDDESDEEDDEEDDPEEESHKSKGKRQVEEEEPQYSAKHLTKIISAKHNKMKNQFTKKYEEAMSQTAGDLEASNAIVSWLAQQSGMTKEQILAKVGYTPSGKKVTADPKLFDFSASNESNDDIDAQVNKIESRIANYPGWKANKKMIVEYAQDTGLPVDKAYWALMGSKAAESARKQGADEAIRRKTNKAARQTENSGGAAKVKTFTRDDREAAKAVGMSVEDYVKYSKVESYDDYQKANAKKKTRR